MSIRERIEDFRDRLFDSGVNVARRFMPDLAPPPERGNHKEATALLERGRKAYNSKNYPRAEILFRQAVDSDESYGKAHYYLGLVMYKLHDSQAAIQAWKRATEVDRGGPISHKAERKINYVKGHVDRTVSELQDRINR
jgi:tetratricopeptide (TPR) repeat protein